MAKAKSIGRDATRDSAINERPLSAVLGHSTIGMTLGTYSHVLPDMQREAADRMDAVLGGVL